MNREKKYWLEAELQGSLPEIVKALNDLIAVCTPAVIEDLEDETQYLLSDEIIGAKITEIAQ